ncbi:UTP--glucose-1-phosphate uridylyltransferase-like [Hibiscus syriacus]|uniref:UTP--glucose-1-phosphate uridylyltransferase-like n=1 Tax=Hibiscus syriacus TaxID=106335 RepID=UPI0019220348|nr:UTP--glucose-1-phosphate uridylyltransferase-like [Hibiscus syriacus]
MLEKKKDREKGIGTKATSEDKVESAGESEGTASDEVLVVPYDNLAPLSDDNLLDKLVVVKFDEASGKNMGFNGPKSLMEVKNGSTHLDLIVNQIQSLNSKYGCNIPLFLMNSKRTHNDILKVLEKYSSSDIDIHPFELGEQTKDESIFSEGGEDEWQSSNHGAQFLSLVNGGTLDVLLSQGKEYAFVVNPDNVGSVVDPNILNHLAQNSIEYCSEVMPTNSTGLINVMASSLHGKFKLEDFTSDNTQKFVKGFKFIDTRNLWLNLKAIKRLVGTSVLGLDSLSNSKLFQKSVGVSIPQSHFLPLNSTSDLLLLQSDLYTFKEGILVRNDKRVSPSDPHITLGPKFKKISDFKTRFKTIPSIVKLDSLEVEGDVWFGADVILKGKVIIDVDPGQPLRIPDGAVLEDKEIDSPSDI